MVQFAQHPRLVEAVGNIKCCALQHCRINLVLCSASDLSRDVLSCSSQSACRIGVSLGVVVTMMSASQRPLPHRQGAHINASSARVCARVSALAHRAPKSAWVIGRTSISASSCNRACTRPEDCRNSGVIARQIFRRHRASCRRAYIGQIAIIKQQRSTSRSLPTTAPSCH